MEQSESLTTISVAGVDDHPVVLSGLSGLSSVRPEIVITASAASVDELLGADAVFDVVLLDLRLNDGSLPRENVDKLIAAGAKVLVYTEGDRPTRVADAVAAGALGAVLKSSPLDVVAEAIISVFGGGFALSPELEDALARDAMVRPEFSDRELEVLRSVGLGLADKQIARVLGISEDTVKEYVRRIRAKYTQRGRSVGSRVELYRRALEDGISEYPARRNDE